MLPHPEPCSGAQIPMVFGGCQECRQVRLPVDIPRETWCIVDCPILRFCCDLMLVLGETLLAELQPGLSTLSNFQRVGSDSRAIRADHSAVPL